MRRRSNWPLFLLLLTAVAVQAGLSLTGASSAGNAGGASVARDGYICTACGPIATGACELKDAPANNAPSAID